jgi:hypothetical protein
MAALHCLGRACSCEGRRQTSGPAYGTDVDQLGSGMALLDVAQWLGWDAEGVDAAVSVKPRSLASPLSNSSARERPVIPRQLVLLRYRASS